MPFSVIISPNLQSSVSLFVSSTEHDPLEEWRRQTGEAASSGEGRTPRPIPQDFRVWEPVGTGFDPRQGEIIVDMIDDENCY